MFSEIHRSHAAEADNLLEAVLADALRFVSLLVKFPNLVRTESRKELQDLLAKDVRKVIITTIHKFAEAGGMLNDRGNIIVMVDEAHRTQEGGLGRKMIHRS